MTTHLESLRSTIETWWGASLDVYPSRFHGECPELSSELTEDDAGHFLLGLNHDEPLFWIEDGYKLRSPLLPRRSDGGLREFHFFEESQGHAWVRAETIVHYAAAAELIFIHGWPLQLVQSEPVGVTKGLSGALDLVVLDTSDSTRAQIAVEAKGSKAKLERLLTEMNRCGGEPGAGHPRTEHQKCRGVIDYRANSFWAVAPGIRTLYGVTRDEAFVRLAPAENAQLLRAP